MQEPSRTRTSLHRPLCSAAMIVAAVLCMSAPLHAQQWQKIVIDSGMIAPVMPRVADMDRDGDQDVVVADWKDNRIFWFENAGDNVSWSRHAIGTGQAVPMGVGIADFDGDTLPDVAAASYTTAGSIDIALAWYRNSLPAGTWPQDVIAYRADNATGATWVDVGDIDGDGDNDILLSVDWDNILIWVENTGGSPIAWSLRPIHETAGVQGGQIVLRDMDEDGDPDIVTGMKGKDRVVWFESQRQGLVWKEHPIDTLLPNARAVTVGDYDYDGDLDVVAGGAPGHAVVLCRQIRNGAEVSWTSELVDSTLGVPGRVEMLEIDGGPTREIVATSYHEDIVVWYQKQGDTWLRKYIDANLPSARGSCTADIDGDGNDELVIAAQEGSGDLLYYRNNDLVPRISCSPGTLDFGYVMVNDMVQMQLEISNTGKGILSIDTLQIMDAGAVPFRVVDPTPFRLDPGEKTTRSITCTPRVKDAWQSTLRVASSDPFTPALQIDLLAESVTDSIPFVRVSPPALDFGDVRIGRKAYRTLTITNIGTGDLSIDALRIRGSDPVPFGIHDPGPFTLHPRQWTSLTVRCTPVEDGEKRDALHILSSDPEYPDVTVPLRVNGESGRTPHISISTRTLHFGTVELNNTVTRELVITNAGDGPLIVDTLLISGDAACPFTLDDACCFTLAPGDTATRVVRCTPSEKGITQDPLKIACNDPACETVIVNLIVDGVTDIADVPIPHAIRLEQNFPNPFNPVTHIRYALPSQGTVQLNVHDLLGRRVRTLVNDAQSGGLHGAVFDAAGLPSGIYVYRLRWNGQTVSRTMMLMK